MDACKRDLVVASAVPMVATNEFFDKLVLNKIHIRTADAFIKTTYDISLDFRIYC